MKATRRLAIVGSVALSALLIAGPAYAGDDPDLGVKCKKEMGDVNELQESQDANQEGVLPIAITDLIEEIEVLTIDVLEDINIQDVTVLDSANVLSPGSNAVTCR